MSISRTRIYPVSANEEKRLSELYAYNILDSDPEPGFDRIAALAARVFDAPIALVSLVDDERQWFKAKYGLEASETSRDFSFCTYAMLGSEPMVVPDATRDVRFQINPLVQGEMSIRFYVGAPILSTNGLPMGTLSVIDTVVRERPAQNLLDSLTDLAKMVSELMEFRSQAATRSEQLELARRSAEAANAAKSDFLARMSHEIRTPMNLIMGMNSLLLESRLDEKQRQYLEISNRNVKRLLRLINGILDLSKVESGRLDFEVVPFDLMEVVTECQATLSAAMESKGLGFQVTTDPGVWRYWIGDAERLQQVLLNVLGNSVKFTSSGRIDLKISPQSNLEGQPGLRFEVDDSGCGIPAGKAELIFEVFEQAEEADDHSYEGTGLGLPIVRTLLERMGGKIWVEQKAEPGARFVFTLFLPPSTEDAARKPAARATQTEVINPHHVARVLLVEDNSENVTLMQAYLENAPVALDFAVNGREAVEKRMQNTYDLLLMDIQMPVMDGYTASREIRAWEQSRGLERVPIVALTAHAFKGVSEDCLQAGCDGYLTKPVERSRLLETIAKFAQAPSPSEANAQDGHAEAAGFCEIPDLSGGTACALSADEDTELPEAVLAYRPIFLEKRVADLQKMRDALAAGDFTLIKSIGHNCKGTAKGYGFAEISRLGKAIEAAAKASDTALLAHSISAFDRYLQTALAYEASRAQPKDSKKL